jgi:hypothetical protein
MTPDAIRTIVNEAIKALPNAVAQLPMPVWDNGKGWMGIQIIQKQTRDGVPCELIASLVLTKREQDSAELCRLKVKVTVAAMIQDVQIVVRPVQRRMPKHNVEDDIGVQIAHEHEANR